MRISFYIVFFVLGTSLAFAHGEDKPGPNGGFIRMPGGFHTEVVPTTKNTFKVYLLDIQWKHPSLKNSSLDVALESNTEKVSAKCAKKIDFYQCSLPKTIDLSKKGSLLVKAQREGQQGAEIAYDLPLRLQVIDDGHGEHNKD